jgi:H2-forming N5,N10-methylenetetrahydromethanopterin dehydrogenase-like enzyme
MKQICQSKYEQETSQHEYEFLKQQIAYYNLPSQSFECSTISHHPVMDSIQNVTVQEALRKQFKEVAIQSRIALFNMYLKSAEDQREEYKNKHKANVKKINESQYTLNKNEKLSSTLVQLINERCIKISERIRCIYKLKSESIPAKS